MVPDAIRPLRLSARRGVFVDSPRGVQATVILPKAFLAYIGFAPGRAGSRANSRSAGALACPVPPGIVEVKTNAPPIVYG